jgi:hypothetical protein
LGGAAHGKLRAGHAVEDFDLLGVDGLVAVEEVGSQFLELGGILDANDGEAGGGEAMLDGVLRRAGFAFRSAGAGTSGSVGAVDGNLMHGCGLAPAAFGLLNRLDNDGILHMISLPDV